MEFAPNYVHPLGLSDLRMLLQHPKAAVEMNFEAAHPLINGQQQTGRANVKTKIAFNEPPTIYALVHRGWLPMPFAIPPRFLVDRNVVISLRKLRLGRLVSSGPALMWWTKLFEKGSATFNPLPYAFEAGFRRKPTMAEFVAAYDEGAAELREALPRCDVIRFEQVHYLAAYAQLEAFDSQSESESEFLLRTCPLVVDRTSRHKEQEVVGAILNIADQCRVPRTAFVVLAVLSCLYEDVHGSPPSIGRQVIKPKRTYTEFDAFNALSDLRHIELAASGQAYFRENAFSLCTCDRAIALFWCALSLRGESLTGVGVEFTFDLTTDLFPRLSATDLESLKLQLRARPLTT